MASFLSGIIPFNITNIDNKENALAQLNSILERLQNYWHFTKGFTIQIDEGSADDISFYRLELPNGIGSIELKEGFIYIDTAFKLHQYFSGPKDNMWFRNMIYDLTIALGCETAYIGHETYFENRLRHGKDWDDYNYNINDWLAENSSIPMYDDSTEIDLYHLPDWAYLVQETFAHSIKRKQILEQQFPNHTILSTANFGDCFVLALDKNSELVLLNELSNKTLNCGKIDGICCRLDPSVFLLYKGNTKALYSCDGTQITDYDNNDYFCRWNESTLKIINDKTGRVEYQKEIQMTQHHA